MRGCGSESVGSPMCSGGILEGPAPDGLGAPKLGARPLGHRPEAEWIPGHWHTGSVCDVDAQGRYTIHYDDGYIQSCVEPERVRLRQEACPGAGLLGGGSCREPRLEVDGAQLHCPA